MKIRPLIPEPARQSASTKTLTQNCSSEWPSLTTKCGSQAVRSKETDIWQYRGFFGHAGLRKYTKSLKTYAKASEEQVYQEWRLLYLPAFIQIAFELRHRGGFSLLPKSLQSFQVLSFSSWSKITDLIWENDVAGFKRAFSHNELSPFARDALGWTLLHEASLFQSAELCSLLVQLGVDADQTDVNGRKALNLVRSRFGGPQAHFDTARILMNAQDDIQFDDLWCASDRSSSLTLKSFELLLSIPDFVDIREFPPLSLALCQYSIEGSRWGPLIRRLLRAKADIHARSPVQRRISGALFSDSKLARLGKPAEMVFTPLDELFRPTRDLFDATLKAKEWLAMLSESGHDITAYLKEEMHLHSGQFFLSYPLEFHSTDPGGVLASRKLIFDVGTSANVCWDWSIDPSSPASLVRQEFRDINLFAAESSTSNYYSWERSWPFI